MLAPCIPAHACCSVAGLRNIVFLFDSRPWRVLRVLLSLPVSRRPFLSGWPPHADSPCTGGERLFSSREEGREELSDDGAGTGRHDGYPQGLLATGTF